MSIIELNEFGNSDNNIIAENQAQRKGPFSAIGSGIAGIGSGITRQIGNFFRPESYIHDLNKDRVKRSVAYQQRAPKTDALIKLVSSTISKEEQDAMLYFPDKHPRRISGSTPKRDVTTQISPKEYKKLKRDVIDQVKAFTANYNDRRVRNEIILDNKDVIADLIIFGVDPKGIHLDFFSDGIDLDTILLSIKNSDLCNRICSGEVRIVHDEELKFIGNVHHGNCTSKELQHIQRKLTDVVRDLCTAYSKGFRYTFVNDVIDGNKFDKSPEKKRLLQKVLMDPRLNSRDREVILGIQAGQMIEITPEVLKQEINEYKNRLSSPMRTLHKVGQLALGLERMSWNFASLLSKYTIGIVQTPLIHVGDIGDALTGLVAGACLVAQPFIAIAFRITVVALGILVIGIAISAIIAAVGFVASGIITTIGAIIAALIVLIVPAVLGYGGYRLIKSIIVKQETQLLLGSYYKSLKKTEAQLKADCLNTKNITKRQEIDVVVNSLQERITDVEKVFVDLKISKPETDKKSIKKYLKINKKIDEQKYREKTEERLNRLERQDNPFDEIYLEPQMNVDIAIDSNDAIILAEIPNEPEGRIAHAKRLLSISNGQNHDVTLQNLREQRKKDRSTKNFWGKPKKKSKDLEVSDFFEINPNNNYIPNNDEVEPENKVKKEKRKHNHFSDEDIGAYEIMKMDD